MRYSIRTVTPAAQIPLPVDLEEAKAFAKIEVDTDDTLFEAQVRTAMDMVERFASQVLSPRVLEMVADRFPVMPELITLPREPVTGIVSVAYTSASGDLVEMAAAEWRWSDVAADQLLPAFRGAWPIAARERGSVRIRFNAGYGAGLCPPSLAEAVRRTAAALYDRRTDGGDLSDDVKSLCRPFRRFLL